MAPKEPLGYANLGLTYLRESRFSDAEAQLRRATELDPTNPQKLYCLVLGDGAGTKSGVYSQTGTGAWAAEGQIEAFSPVDLVLNQSSASRKTAVTCG